MNIDGVVLEQGNRISFIAGTPKDISHNVLGEKFMKKGKNVIVFVKKRSSKEKIVIWLLNEISSKCKRATITCMGYNGRKNKFSTSNLTSNMIDRETETIKVSKPAFTITISSRCDFFEELEIDNNTSAIFIDVALTKDKDSKKSTAINAMCDRVYGEGINIIIFNMDTKTRLDLPSWIHEVNFRRPSTKARFDELKKEARKIWLINFKGWLKIILGIVLFLFLLSLLFDRPRERLK